LDAGCRKGHHPGTTSIHHNPAMNETPRPLDAPDPALERGHRFLALHRSGPGFLMPNAWDAGSAIVLAAEGFAALGSTSAGIAFAHGRPDYAVQPPGLALDRDAMLAALRRIVQAVPQLPVNADLEAGYGDRPEAVAETVRLAIEAGAAGGNLEDADAAGGGLFDIGLAGERIAAAREAIRASGRPFVLTARTDALMLGRCSPEAMADTVRRGRHYREAGADCIFPPGASDPATARRLVQEIGGPINLVLGLGESSGNARALVDAGVQRISVGGSIARAALGLVRRAARELRDQGSVSYAAGQIPQGELNALFAQARR
jgi:2-methylisocitrate lyase-like PEP mutase family enzyme